MTRRRFQLARHLRDSRPWDFFMMVEMGPDRLHHGFWQYYDRSTPTTCPAPPTSRASATTTATLDAEIGALIDGLGDDTALMVVSDHGAQSMVGGICVNEWLIREGYLTLKEQPRRPAPVKPDMIDWPRTRVWGDGGYYSRIFLNVRGREPEGVVEPSEVEALRDELTAKLEALGDEQGELDRHARVQAGAPLPQRERRRRPT